MNMDKTFKHPSEAAKIALYRFIYDGIDRSQKNTIIETIKTDVCTFQACTDKNRNNLKKLAKNILEFAKQEGKNPNEALELINQFGKSYGVTSLIKQDDFPGLFTEENTHSTCFCS